MKRGYAILLAAAGLISIPLIDRYIDYKVEVSLNRNLDTAIERVENNQHINLLEDTIGIIENKVILESEISVPSRAPYIDSATIGTLVGEGLIVSHKEKDYIITAAHVVTFNEIVTDYGIIKIEDSDSSTSWNDIGLEEVVIDNERDIAIFNFPEGHKKPDYNVRLGESEKLMPFEKVYLIGNPGLSGLNIREGIISNIEDKRMVGPMETEGMNISISVFPGDSGSPVINENGKVIGIAKENHYNITGYISPIDWYKEHMD